MVKGLYLQRELLFCSPEKKSALRRRWDFVFVEIKFCDDGCGADSLTLIVLRPPDGRARQRISSSPCPNAKTKLDFANLFYQVNAAHDSE